MPRTNALPKPQTLFQGLAQKDLTPETEHWPGVETVGLFKAFVLYANGVKAQWGGAGDQHSVAGR
jgi:hypothetical protein